MASVLLGGLGSSSGWHRRVTMSTYFPNIAGETLITRADQPYSPVVALLTLIGSAAAALLAGAVALNTRDA